jgi:hypothetical protein
VTGADRQRVRRALDARRRELVADVNVQEAQKVYGRHAGPARGWAARRDDDAMGVERAATPEISKPYTATMREGVN